MKLEDGLTVSGQIAPEEITRLAASGVRRIVNLRPDDEAADQLPAAEAARIAAGHGIDYRHIPVTMRSLSMDAVWAFGDAAGPDSGPVHAHCGSGLRAATLWGLHQVVSGRMGRNEARRQIAAAGFDLGPGLAWLDTQPEGAPT